MSGFGIKVNFKAFFDASEIIDALDRAERKQLSRIGAFLRRRARSKLGRKTIKSANAGQPPNVHSSGFRSIKTIFFQYEKATRSVVTGPILLNTSKVRSSKTLPQLLEDGGTAEVPIDGGESFVTAHYDAFPFMGPTLEEEVAAGTLLDVWDDSVVP